MRYGSSPEDEEAEELTAHTPKASTRNAIHTHTQTQKIHKEEERGREGGRELEADSTEKDCDKGGERKRRKKIPWPFR